MKQYLILAILVCSSALLLSNCHTKKKSMANTAPTAKISYAVNMKDVIATHCSPCHIPEKGGNKKPLDTYDNLKSSIDDAIRRISLNPTDRGFMPFRNPKLSDSTIALFTQWRDAGMPE